MRVLLSLGLGVALLSGCVAPVATAPGGAVVNPSYPAPQPAQPTAPSLDSASQAVARDVVNREMAKRFPGRNVASYTDCITANASMAEMADIAARGVNDSAAAAGAIADVVKRPATTQCIAKVAAVA